MISLRVLVATLCVLATAHGFLPSMSKNTCTTGVKSTSSLHFGFLKDLGLEKPSWLPDFGSKKSSEEPNAEATNTEEETDETVAESLED